MKIKKNDTVLIIKGKDRSKTGKVTLVNPTKQTVVVEGVNLYKKHAKPSKKYPQGGIIDVNMPVKSENVMVVCPGCKKAVRISYKNEGKDKRRICVKCKEMIDAS